MALPFAIPAAVSSLPWKWIGIGALVLLLAGAVLAYGESRADGREAKVNARWEAAAAALEEASDEAAAEAEEGAVEREKTYAEKLKNEKEKLDEVEAAGGDPFDALFPAG